MDLVTWAALEAETRLGPLGRRLTHVQQVAARAREIAAPVVGADAELLVAAAYLHDIGYAPELATTGFHPLDGARFVRDIVRHHEVAGLVAHHTGARNEARIRGFDVMLVEFPYEDSELLRALTYCDITTGPDGSRVKCGRQGLRDPRAIRPPARGEPSHPRGQGGVGADRTRGGSLVGLSGSQVSSQLGSR